MNPALVNPNLLAATPRPSFPITSSQTNIPDDPALRDAFYQFVGETFFGHLLAAMRKTVPQAAYFHGGRTEEVFQNQLDQLWAEKLAESSAEQFAKPMFELFMLERR